MEKRKNFWLGFAMLAIGVVIGFLIAPIKKGVNVKHANYNQLNPNDLEYLDDCDCSYEEIEDDTEDVTAL